MSKKLFISERSRMQQLAGIIINENVIIGPGGSMSGFEEPKSSTYEVITYDVCGNEEDGWDVNQSFKTGHFVEIPDDMHNNADIVTLLKHSNILNDNIKPEMYDIDMSHEQAIYFNLMISGKPAFELRRTEQ